VQFQVSFSGQETPLEVAQSMRGQQSSQDINILVQCPVMYDSVRHFLKELKTIDPADVPFGDIIRRSQFDDVTIPLPAYAASPGCILNLDSLLRPGGPAGLQMSPSSSGSVTSARNLLYKHGKLDRRYVSKSQS
jgi:hypothetical protein